MHGGMRSTAGDLYRGADRRRRPISRTSGIRGPHVLAFAVALLVLAGLVPAGLSTIQPRSSALAAQGALRTIWASLFLCAGLLHLVRWKITGHARTGLRGSAALCLGLFTLPSTAIAALLYRSASEASLSPITRTLAVCTCLALLSRAVRVPD